MAIVWNSDLARLSNAETCHEQARNATRRARWSLAAGWLLTALCALIAAGNVVVLFTPGQTVGDHVGSGVVILVDLAAVAFGYFYGIPNARRTVAISAEREREAFDDLTAAKASTETTP